jgi:hypothetical protein
MDLGFASQVSASTSKKARRKKNKNRKQPSSSTSQPNHNTTAITPSNSNESGIEEVTPTRNVSNYVGTQNFKLNDGDGRDKKEESNVEDVEEKQQQDKQDDKEEEKFDSNGKIRS